MPIALVTYALIYAVEAKLDLGGPTMGGKLSQEGVTTSTSRGVDEYTLLSYHYHTIRFSSR